MKASKSISDGRFIKNNRDSGGQFIRGQSLVNDGRKGSH